MEGRGFEGKMGAFPGDWGPASSLRPLGVGPGSGSLPRPDCPAGLPSLSVSRDLID